VHRCVRQDVLGAIALIGASVINFLLVKVNFIWPLFISMAVFLTACQYGNLCLVQQLADNNVLKFADDGFRLACGRGHLKVAKWLLRVKPPIDIRATSDTAFRSACFNGHLKVAQWLLSVEPSINICLYDDAVFRLTCYYGHLKVAKWLLSVEPSIDIRRHNNVSFRCACVNGNLKVAKWLQSVDPSIDVHNTDIAFRSACTRGPLKIAKWLRRQCLAFEDEKTGGFSSRRAVQLVSFF
jgi:hypothetical protein